MLIFCGILTENKKNDELLLRFLSFERCKGVIILEISENAEKCAYSRSQKCRYSRERALSSWTMWLANRRLRSPGRDESESTIRCRRARCLWTSRCPSRTASTSSRTGHDTSFFLRLVLCCIEADFNDQGRIFQHFFEIYKIMQLKFSKFSKILQKFANLQ